MSEHMVTVVRVALDDVPADDARIPELLAHIATWADARDLHFGLSRETYRADGSE